MAKRKRTSSGSTFTTDESSRWEYLYQESYRKAKSLLLRIREEASTISAEQHRNAMALVRAASSLLKDTSSRTQAEENDWRNSLAAMSQRLSARLLALDDSKECHAKDQVVPVKLKQSTQLWQSSVLIVAYVDEGKEYEVAMLYGSWKYCLAQAMKQQVVANCFDLLLYCAPEACSRLPDECLTWKLDANAPLPCTWSCFRRMLPIDPAAHQYPFLNSFAPFQFDIELNSASMKYHRLLRTDVDTFLVPSLLDFRPKNSLVVGHGAYSSDSATHRLRDIIAPSFGLIAKSSHWVNNLGSTWYGRPRTLLPLLRLARNLTMRLLHSEFDPETALPDMPPLSWPGWWRGVASMYGSELALNSDRAALLLRERLRPRHRMAFDISANSKSTLEAVLHLHAGNTLEEERFGKLGFRSCVLQKACDTFEVEVEITQANGLLACENLIEFPSWVYCSAVAWSAAPFLHLPVKTQRVP